MCKGFRIFASFVLLEIPNRPLNVQVVRNRGQLSTSVPPGFNTFSVRWEAPDNSERFDLEYFKVYVLSEQGNSYIANGTSTKLEYYFDLNMIPQQNNVYIIVTTVNKCSQEGLRSQVLEWRESISKAEFSNTSDTVTIGSISATFKDSVMINGNMH